MDTTPHVPPGAPAEPKEKDHDNEDPDIAVTRAVQVMPTHDAASHVGEGLGTDSETFRGGESDGYYPMTLDVDSQEDGDVDSTMGTVPVSSPASLRSSLYESVEENGRKYHRYKEGAYYLPNDEIEQDRLDLQHHLFLLTLDGRLNLAPVANAHRVLDLGTGTGIWAMEYATQNPSASVIGTDLSAIQPDYVPPNCQFEIDDAEDEWLFRTKFNFIHGRALFSCFKDPAAVFKKAYNALEPGGYFEMQEIYFKPHSVDGTVDGTALAEWNQLLVDGAKHLGRDWHCTRNYKQWFEEVGFEEVFEGHFQWPMNTWPKGRKNKTLGLWTLTNGLGGLAAVSMAIMTRVLGMSAEAVEAVLVNVRRDMNDRRIHAYYPIRVVYGRKPL